MSLTLARLVVEGAGTSRVRVSEKPDPSALGQRETQRLLAKVQAGQLPGILSEWCEPLDDDRIALGRQEEDVAVWRVGTREELDALRMHPSWLWTIDELFDPRGPADRVPVPAWLPLRQLVLLAGGVSGKGAGTHATLASTVSALRKGAPVAVVVDQRVMQARGVPVRWMALAVLAALPPSQRDQIRVGTSLTRARADQFDLVYCDAPIDGYTIVDARAPARTDADLVSYFVRDRLRSDDAEAVEALAYLYDGPGSHYEERIEHLIRDGVAVSDGASNSFEVDPDSAAKALAARLQAGADLTPELTEELIALTRRTQDVRPWQVLWRRPATQRSNAVLALLDEAATIRPSGELIRELCNVYPRGASLDPWLYGLLGWLEEGVSTQAVIAAIQTTLLEWPPSATRTLRVSVWPDVVRRLAQLGEVEAAVDAVVRSPVASEMARDGSAQVLVEAWASVPREARTEQATESLVLLLHGVPDGDKAVARLFRQVRSLPNEAEAVVRAWVSQVLLAPSASDPVLAVVRGTPALSVWAKTMLEGDPTARDHALRRWAPSPDDPLRKALGDRSDGTEVAERGESAGDRLLHLVQTGRGSEDRMLAILEDALLGSTFPDASIAKVAETMAGQRNTNRVWGWVALAAGAPDTWDDETIDATVVAFCNDPPSDPRGARIAGEAARRLGAARRWEPLDHARWLVRLSLAPPGPLNKPLAGAILEGISQRTDGAPFLAEMFLALLELPPDHPATNWLLELLIPSGWRGERLGRVLKAVPLDAVPRQLRDAWEALTHAARR